MAGKSVSADTCNFQQLYSLLQAPNPSVKSHQHICKCYLASQGLFYSSHLLSNRKWIIVIREYKNYFHSGFWMSLFGQNMKKEPWLTSLCAQQLRQEGESAGQSFLED